MKKDGSTLLQLSVGNLHFLDPLRFWSSFMFCNHIRFLLSILYQNVNKGVHGPKSFVLYFFNISCRSELSNYKIVFLELPSVLWSPQFFWDVLIDTRTPNSKLFMNKQTHSQSCSATENVHARKCGCQLPKYIIIKIFVNL